ncbi:transposase zinc-binding domain protein [Escherichia coli C-34666]|nr:transposase zinc-binding domain protein [Escherichia coli C-34666]
MFLTGLLPHKKACFRCKSRSCPHCGVKAGAQWIQYLLSLVPDCPWQHIVFTLPAYFHERRSLNNFHRDRVITFEQIAE